MKKVLIIVIGIIAIGLILILSFKFGYNIVQENLNTEKTETVSNNFNMKSKNTTKEENLVENIVENETEKMDAKEAEKLLDECYQKASDCYRFSSYNVSNEEQTIEYKGQYVSVYEIYNFQEVLRKCFTENKINNMIKKFPLLIAQDNKYYFELGSIAEDYDNVRFKDIQIENDKITATAVVDIYADEIIEKDVESEFIIIKSDDKWLVDEYKNVTEIS